MEGDRLVLNRCRRRGKLSAARRMAVAFDLGYGRSSWFRTSVPLTDIIHELFNAGFRGRTDL